MTTSVANANTVGDWERLVDRHFPKDYKQRFLKLLIKVKRGEVVFAKETSLMPKYSSWKDVLRDWKLEEAEPAWETIWKYFLQYRLEKKLDVQCDETKCLCAKSPPMWNSQPLKVQLDHIDGNSQDHRPENLRLLCPNCHSQTPTYAGKNQGTVVRTSGNSYEVNSADGTKKIAFKAEGGASIGGAAIVEVIPANGGDE